MTNQAGAQRPRLASRLKPRELAREAPAPWDKTLQSWNPIIVLVLAALGAVGGVLLLLVNAEATRDSARFVGSPDFQVWAAVIAVQSAVWAVVTVPLWREVISTYRVTDPSPMIWLVPAIIVAALALLAVLSPARDVEWPLVGHQIKAWILTAAAAIGVGVPAVFGICIVQDQVRRHQPDKLTAQDISLALEARAQMRRFLGVAGAVISLAVLASGALRRAVVPAYFGEQDFPPSAVLLYGAFFTALLLIVYVPAHLSLRRFCVDLREQYYPVSAMPPPTSAEFTTWIDGRNRIDTLTEVTVTTSQQLQTSIFILAPLASGLLGALAPTLT